MKNSQYLYGDSFSAQIMSNMQYITALGYKNECAKKLISDLARQPTMQTDWRRINAVSKAISFNTALLKEAKGED